MEGQSHGRPMVPRHIQDLYAQSKALYAKWVGIQGESEAFWCDDDEESARADFLRSLEQVIDACKGENPGIRQAVARKAGADYLGLNADPGFSRVIDRLNETDTSVRYAQDGMIGIGDTESGLGTEASTPAVGQTTAAPSKNSRPPLIVLIVVLVALIGGGLWWLSFTGSPANSLARAAVAVEEGDWAGVQEYVDVDAVLREVVAIVAFGSSDMEDTLNSGSPAEINALDFSSLLQASTPPPEAVVKLKQELRRRIEAGTDSSQGDPVVVLTMYVLSKRVAGNNVKSVKYVGDEALVTVEGPEEGDLETFRMKRAGGHWRVIGIGVPPAKR